MSESKPSRSLANIAGIVAVATLLSKVFGLFRQQAIAAAFGAGSVVGAFNYAYVVPGFLLILLGGINGPFHSAMVSVLAKRKREEIAPIMESITTLVVGILLLVTIALVIFAEPLMRVVGPGLFLSATQQETRELAILQFRIMAPMAMLAGLIGIGFGALNAADQYWLPSISPLFSSVAVLLGLGGLTAYLGADILSSKYVVLGSIVLAATTLAGAVIQWLMQLPAQWRSGLGGFRLRFDFRQPEVQEVIKIMGPATFSSGMMQINVWTDLFFASFIPNAAAAVSAMGYAGLLVQTPLGILSNVILVPLLPVFSKLAAPEHWGELKGRIRQGLMMTAIAMLPLSALMVVLAVPLTRVVYERYAFTADDSYLTASVLVAYAIGMFVYLGRDVLVRVFYAMGDGDTPFRISIFNIFLNALLDFFLVKPFGAPGLVMATVGVNFVSMLMLLWMLDRKLNGLPLKAWSVPIAGLAVISGVSGLAAWGTLQGLAQVWHTDGGGFWLHLTQVCLAGLVGLAAFALLVSQLRIPEVSQFTDRVKQKLRRS